jgi:hypothetical protein
MVVPFTELGEEGLDMYSFGVCGMMASQGQERGRREVLKQLSKS